MAHHDLPPASTSLPPRDVDRRSFLKRAGAACLSATAATSLGAYEGSTASAKSTSGLKPKYGGTLTLGVLGGGSGDTLNPCRAIANIDWARLYQLYEPLVYYDVNAVPQPWLATEVTPSKGNKLWTIRLRKGVTFHNGKPLTAADVLYTFQTAVNPKTASDGASALAGLDVAGMRVRDNLTIEIPFLKPFASFYEVLPAYYYSIIPEGMSPSTPHPIGTGPFMFKGFVPGQESVFVRNPNYWRHGLPYLDTIAIQDFADETSLLNALDSNQVDAISGLSASSAPIVTSSGGVVTVSTGASWNTFVMNTKTAPFTDVRVRQALRLLVDRPSMRSRVVNGHGALGNDVFGIVDPVYDHSLPQRTQDIDQAKSLLRAAGHAHLTLDLVVAPIEAGIIEMAQVLAQQASAANVTIKIRQVTETALFGPNFGKWPFTVDFWFWENYFPQVLGSTLPYSSTPETQFHNARYAQLYTEAQAAVDDSLRTELAHEMQMIDYDQGGYITPFFLPSIVGTGAHVHGIVTSLTGVDFANYNFSTAWKT